MNSRFAIGFTILLSAISISAQSLSGFIYEESGEVLAGANIFIMNSNTGTSSNAEGYYSLKLTEGSHDIIFSFIGYRSDTLSVTVKENENIIKNISLVNTSITTSQVTVYAGKFSEAELLVLKVLEKKDEYLSKLKNYTYQAYTKNVLSVTRNDSDYIGGILETLSEAVYEYPDKFNETIIARRQTKNFNEAINIFSAGKVPNVLDDEIRIDELRITSPLSSNALYYYKYELLDTIYSGNRMVFKLRFRPKYEDQPLFDGTVNIVDKIHTPNSIVLYGRNRIQGSMKQAVEIREDFREYENYFWLPVIAETKFEMDMGFPGIPPITFEQASLISNYKINDPEFNYKFGKILFSYSRESTNDTSGIWKRAQVIPLTIKEKKAACKIDSVMTHGSFILKSTVALSQSYPVISALPFTSLSDFYHYNRVEGNYWGIGLDSKKYFYPFNLKMKIGLGSLDEIIKYKFNFNAELAKNILYLSAAYYKDITYLNSYYDYSQFDITYQALIENNDYADYYYVKGFSFGFSYRSFRDLEFKSDFMLEEHIGRFEIAKLTGDDKIIDNSKAAQIKGGLNHHIKFDITYNNLKYIDYGWITEPDISQDYTYIKLSSDFSPPGFLDSDLKYSNFHLYIDKHNKLTRLLNLNLILMGGIQFGDKALQHLFHLPGSYGTFGKSNLLRSVRSDKYLGDRYYCLFIQNNFRNNIFKMLHIPWLKNSKLELLTFFNAGKIRSLQQEDHYKYSDVWEAGIGFGNIINFFRLDLSWGKIRNSSDYNITMISRIEF